MNNDAPRGRPPWTLEEREESFVVLDADGRPLYHVNFRRPSHKPDALDRMTRDEAIKVAQPLLRLPELLKAEKRRKPDG
jgi:hypothetical protein